MIQQYICKPSTALCSLGLLVAVGLSTGCVHVKTDPIRIEPIYINITINHKIQRELDDIFAALDRQSAATEYIPLEEK